MRGLVGIRQILLNDGVFGEDFLTLQSQRRDAAFGLIFRKFPPVSVCLVLRLTDSNSHAMPISCRRMRTTTQQAPLAYQSFITGLWMGEQAKRLLSQIRTITKALWVCHRFLWKRFTANASCSRVFERTLMAIPMIHRTIRHCSATQDCLAEIRRRVVGKTPAI